MNELHGSRVTWSLERDDMTDSTFFLQVQSDDEEDDDNDHVQHVYDYLTQ